jgi:hypothetical protein
LTQKWIKDLSIRPETTHTLLSVENGEVSWQQIWKLDFLDITLKNTSNKIALHQLLNAFVQQNTKLTNWGQSTEK